MAEKTYRASLNKGRSGWCVIFRHPVCKSNDEKQQLRVRRGLGTREEEEAQGLVDELNEILCDPSYWTPASREKAEARFNPRIVAAFYDCLKAEEHCASELREEFLPLPGKDIGYTTVQLVGTTGAGKTTLVRQLLGTHPKKERFPSTSAAKTTVCDLELITASDDFRAVVTFLPRDRVRQYIMECVVAAVAAGVEQEPEGEVARRLMEHGEQKFRLSYILGHLNPKKSIVENELEDEDELEDEGGTEELTEAVEVTFEEQQEMARFLRSVLERVYALADSVRQRIEQAAKEFDIDLAKASPKDRDILQELVEEDLMREEQIVHDNEFHLLVDEILDEVEARFQHIDYGELKKARDGWPTVWTLESNDRLEFIKAVNRFSSNYAPNFGRLLTPIVEGIRVCGNFLPEWETTTQPKLVLLDGQGIGHTADRTSSLSTSITKQFQKADLILLVDNAAQPMQAAPNAVLRTLVSSGHESKLAIAFTHFDEVKGDNLRGSSDKRNHVIGSFFNAVQAIGKISGRDAEQSLRRLHPDRIVFLSKIQDQLSEGARFTKKQFDLLLELMAAAIEPPAPIVYHPVYDVANLVLAIQKATQEFHDRWRGILGLGTRSGVAPEHWTRVKALTRRVGVMKQDEYDSLRPIADLISSMQSQISSFLGTPLEWKPKSPPEESEAERVMAIDEIKKQVFARLHELSNRRLIDERLSGWVEAYEHRGTGSTKIRAKDMVVLYESAAPVPNEMPGPDLNEFLLEVRELVAESIDECDGQLIGWKREE